MRNTARHHDRGFRARPCARPAAALRDAALLSLALATLGGCATPSGRVAESELPDVVRYSVESGDRLGTIARDFTGDIAVWRTIADLNGIDDPRRLAIGQVIEIPVALIPEADREARLAASVVAPGTGTAGADPDEALARAEAPSPSDAITDDAPAASRPGPTPPAPNAAAVRVASAPVVVSPVRSREAFELSPLDDAQLARADDAGARFIKVLGSYTPKGVYERPAAQSRVMMRVTPGTVLRLEGTVPGWFEVDTGGGAGYLRDTDAQPVQPDRSVGAGG